ncbi:AEC family transporter [Paenibacillus mucilaginosus]|uniref:Auxin Efflux Carrier n=3 Tax=Paenibacillus mucilaginosus TaxID=61624 RepID=H6NC00_9BACL|nr:AEC family transporter [Paenibacillus mucilaginosus]AEI42241.1 Auxin Efflux Carrier [Paenibacillus mucilaginosus KNP414]AFC28032.1 Auxin Efflux Carrier [Paenibacillus mucilaginosus 3016]AFH60201.1 transporter [Paenibacillus mucilaginosus K02]MCG7214204.1 AEC family transporter [Paenibacillus mucilaginosus]WDM28718.1 AEC family transporter [Paenibacillus mucilaginosus]
MTYLVHILLNNVIPLTIMIVVGVVLYRAFKLDIKTLSKLNFYLFSPALVFKMLYESQLSLNLLGQTLLFFFVYFAAMYLLVELVIRVRRYQGGMVPAMRNSVIFYNSANYAIPLNQLVFVGDAFTLSIQIIIMMMQSLLPNTYGIYSVNASKKNDMKDTLRTILTLPVIYIIPVAFFMKGFDIPVPGPIYAPINYVSDAFIATALVTLGVQLGSMKWQLNFSDVMLSNLLRLCIGPAVGFAVVLLLGIEGVMAQALVLSCAVPTSLSSVLIAVEYDNEPEFSSQVVFSSTIFSIFTVTLVIYLMKFIP